MALLVADNVAFGDEQDVVTDCAVFNVSVGVLLFEITEYVFAVLVNDVTQPVRVLVTTKV